MRIEFNGIATPAFRFDQVGGQTVSCISTFPRRPLQLPTYHEVWLDANILSQAPAANPNPNIDALIRNALQNAFGVSPFLAVAEYNRSHDPMTAMEMMLARVPRMEEVYGFDFDMLTVTSQSAQLPVYRDADLAYIKVLADLLIVVKFFYNIKAWGFKRRFEAYAKFVNRHLPSIMIVNYVACLYFFARDRRDLFESSFAKIQEAMHIHSTADRNRKEVHNLASDLAIFTQTTAFPVIQHPPRFRVPYIATSDEGFALLLRELAYFRMDITAGTGHGYPGFRPDGVMSTHCPASVGNTLQTYLVNLPVEPWRKDSLSNIAETILLEPFDYEKYVD